MRQDAEAKLNEIVAEFKKKIEGAVDESLDKIHSEMVPYINDDTEHNSVYRARNMVEAILSGRFDTDINGDITVDGWVVYRMTPSSYDSLVDKLAERCSDVAAQKKIERLEQQLEEAWRVR